VNSVTQQYISYYIGILHLLLRKSSVLPK
jgi:hypothetical protein